MFKVELNIPFVVDGAGGVALSGPFDHLDLVAAETGFIAQTPHDDTGMILERFHHALHPVHERLFPVSPVAGVRALLVAEAVGFNVTFTEHIQTVLVAQFVEDRGVRIVAGTDGVDVVALHLQDVVPDRFHGDRSAQIRVEFVTVHAPDHDAGAIDQQLTFLDLDGAETEGQRFIFDRLASGSAEFHSHRVEVRRFCGPAVDFFQVRLHADFCLGFARFRLDRGGHSLDGNAVRIEDLHICLDPVQIAVFGAADLQIGRELAIGFGMNENIGEVRRIRNCHDGDIPEDAGEPPHILVFQIGAVAPLHDLDRDPVDTDVGDVRDVKFCGQTAALAHAGKLTVDPHVEEGIHAVEHEKELPAVPAVIDLKFPDVAAGGIIIGTVGRRDGNGIEDIGVMRSAVAFHLPVGGNGDGIPFAAVKIFFMEVFGNGFRAGEVSEHPRAVEQFEVGGEGAVQTQCIVFVVKRSIDSSAVHAVDSGECLIFPIVLFSHGPDLSWLFMVNFG